MKTKRAKPPAVPFRMGDEVRYIGDDPERQGEHIIYEASLTDEACRFEYATADAAWFDHTDFELVREADAKSLRKLRKALEG